MPIRSPWRTSPTRSNGWSPGWRSVTGCSTRSTGAADDLAKATDIARAMVLRYGMSEALGNVAYDRDRAPFLLPNFPVPQERNYSEDTAQAVDNAVRSFVGQAFEQASAILRRNRGLLDRTASALLETE